jgi:hypothetical protein
MKILTTIFIITIFFLHNIFITSYGKNMSSVLKQNDGTYLLKHNDLLVSVDPAKGGRITSVKLGAKEFLLTKELNKFSYGSTFWPSPQSDWNWPPPFNLDQAPYEVVDSIDHLVLKSKPDTKLGLQFIKDISISETDSSIQILYSIVNISDKKIKVAPWEITRMSKGGLVFFPKGLTPPRLKNFDPIPYTDSNEVLWYKINENEKLNNHLLSVSDGSEGWLAYTVNNFILIKSFKDILPNAQAPNEGEIPIYIDSKSSAVEIEVEGAYQETEPGEKIDWPMKWYVREIPNDIKPETGNNELVKFVRSTLNR